MEDERVEMIIESEEILIFQHLFHLLLLLLLRIYATYKMLILFNFILLKKYLTFI